MNEELRQDKTLEILINESGLSQSRIAKQVGCSQAVLSLYVSKKRSPGFDKAIAMARVLGVPLKTLAIALGYDVTGIPDD